MRRFVASGFGTGFVPAKLWNADTGAGTVGAALAALLGLALWAAPWWIDLTVAVIAIGVSLWAAVPFATDHADPNWVVIDEIAGTLVALIGLTGWPWLVALVVARLGDIFKVLPGVAPAERLPGAVGVTTDDVVAGLYGLALGWLAALVL
jgi:phosphatidylglycerophosphatase A